ncbi:MAG: NADH-quinone oxidoreductase subunit A [Vulcanimicrobiota bacterium]
MLSHHYAVVAMVILMVAGLALLAAALSGWEVKHPEPDPAWKNYRFGFVVFSLIFLSFDMEMIFMYPWGVVFADIGVSAFLDMLVFIAILSAGIAYAWGQGGLRWE